MRVVTVLLVSALVLLATVGWAAYYGQDVAYLQHKNNNYQLACDGSNNGEPMQGKAWKKGGDAVELTQDGSDPGCSGENLPWESNRHAACRNNGNDCRDFHYEGS